jgi:hypothetical protein
MSSELVDYGQGGGQIVLYDPDQGLKEIAVAEAASSSWGRLRQESRERLCRWRVRFVWLLLTPTMPI